MTQRSEQAATAARAEYDRAIALAAERHGGTTVAARKAFWDEARIAWDQYDAATTAARKPVVS